MTFFYLFFLAFWVENPRIIHDTLDRTQIQGYTDSTYLLNIEGEKLFSAMGQSGNADVFQSTNILISGKTENGWQVEGFLYDERAKPADDIYTIGLSDINTAYLILHRKKDSFVLGRFSLYGRGIDGASLKYTYGPITLKAGGGKTRGLSGIFETILTPPYNVPVKITLKDLEFFTIVEHSERVFINGQMLPNTAYSIDYSRCIITLHIEENLPQINLRVEFEYHTPFDNPYVHGAEFSYNSQLLKTEIKWFSEYSTEKYVYDSTGGVYLPHGGGEYDKKDSIFVYAGNGQGHFRVFFRLDTINGSYIYDDRGFYVFVGNGLGKYSPIVFNRLPDLKDVKEAKLQIGDRFYTGFNAITFSNKTSKETGIGGKLFAGVQTENINFEAGLWRTEGTIEHIETHFDSTRYMYTGTIKNEKFARLDIKGEKLNGKFSFIYDTIPAWLLSVGAFRFNFYARGNNTVRDMALKYMAHRLFLSIFKTSQEIKGASAKMQIEKGTCISSMLMEDSVKMLHYIATFQHLMERGHTRIKIQLTKTNNLFLYTLSSSLVSKNGFFSLEMTRSLDYGTLYMERYVKTGEGNFTYDSSFSHMVPSEFGEYTRIITLEQGDNITYKHTYTISGNIRGKTWQSTTILTMEQLDNNTSTGISMNIGHDILSGSFFSARYEKKRYLTVNNTLAQGHERTLRVSFFRESSISPSLFSTSWKDIFSNMQRYTNGLGLIFKRKDLKFNIEVSKNSNSLINEEYLGFKTNAEFKFAKATMELSGAYSDVKSTILTDTRYIGMSLKRSIRIGGIDNVINAYLFIPQDKKTRWGISTTLKF